MPGKTKPRQRTQNWVDRISGDLRSNTADAKIENAFMGPGSSGGGSYEPLEYIQSNPKFARRVQNWWGENADKYGAWGKTQYGDIGDNGVWDQGEFSGVPGIQTAIREAFPRLGRIYDQAAGPGDPYAGRAARAGRDAGAPSLAGVTDFDTWAGVQRDPMYQRNEERFAFAPPNTFTPPVNIEQTEGGKRPMPGYIPGGPEGGRTDIPGKQPGWVGNVGGPQDGRPVMGNFTAGRRRKPRRNAGAPGLRRYMNQTLGGM